MKIKVNNAYNYVFSLIERVFMKIIRVINGYRILSDYNIYKKNDTSGRFQINRKEFKPQVNDKTSSTEFNSHYIYHTAWAARKLKQINPIKHTDISSSLYFSAITSAFVPIDFYDYRPAQLKLSNLNSYHADLNNLLFNDGSINSLSCMHTVEHIGLGRYGGPINPNGDLTAISELKRVLSNNGSLLFVVPIGKPKIEFNAHRIYSYEQIAEYFKDLTLKEFSLITDSGDFIENANIELVKEQNYGCGCFWFIKR